MSEINWQKLHLIAQETAINTGRYIQSEAHKTHKNLGKVAGTSASSQALTQIDLNADAMIREALEGSTKEYSIGLLTEESKDDATRFHCDYFWCVDPLDGTYSFLHQEAGYAVSIALVAKDGSPVMGYIFDCVYDQLFYACIPLEIKSPILPTNKSNTFKWFLDRSMTKQVDYKYWASQVEILAEKLGYSSMEQHIGMGAATNAIHTISSPNAIYFKTPKDSPGGGSLWDFAASSAIAKMHDAHVSSFNGTPLNLNQKELFMNQTGVFFAQNNTANTFLLVQDKAY